MFHLPFSIAPSQTKINLSDEIVLLGSCFADSIGDKLITSKFRTTSNPFGTIYQPLAIFKILSQGINKNSIIKNQDIFYHWDTHGEVSSLDEQELKSIADEKQNSLQEKLKNAKWLILTFGSAYAYRLKSDGQLVANCHKIPSSEFDKELLSVETISKGFERTYKHLQEINPDLKIILTISPVRHVRDGLAENNRSKARLIEATQSIVENREACSYFPAYEIMIDELRDYRFYTEDRVHPNQEAVDYIWQRFSATYFADQTQIFLKKWTGIQSAVKHRPFHAASKQHQEFLKKTIDELRVMKDTVDVSVELSLLESQLTK
ncbi:MAG: GSCFA domain-containing protein [Cytophagales bacterium]|nr:GSCFA domain-containing protein [Cytophagales bacterium]